MANKKTITDYFELLKQTMERYGIAQVDEEGNIKNDTITGEKIYLADETGWGVQSKKRKVYAAKGAKHVFIRKPHGGVLKSLVVLEKSFPLLGEDEACNIPDVLLSKTDNRSMDQACSGSTQTASKSRRDIAASFHQ